MNRRLRRTAACGAMVGLVALTAACSGGGGTTDRKHGSAQGSPASSSSPSEPSVASGSATGAPHLTEQVMSWRLPAPRSRSVAMTYAGAALVAGGLEPGDRSTDQVLRVDLAAGRVSPAGRLAQPLHDSAGGLLAGRPTVVGGGGATELSGVEQRSPSGGWHVVGQLPGARSDLSVVSAGGNLVIIGGYDGTTTPTSVLRTADGAHFAQEAALPSGVRYAGAVRAASTVWILGGENAGHELDGVLRLDLGPGSVRTAGHLPHPLGHEAVAVVGDRLLVMGGRTTPDQVTDQMWWFTPRTGRWTRAGTLPYPVADAPAVVSGNSVYLFGGETPSFTDKVTRVSWTP